MYLEDEGVRSRSQMSRIVHRMDTPRSAASVFEFVHAGQPLCNPVTVVRVVAHDRGEKPFIDTAMCNHKNEVICAGFAEVFDDGTSAGNRLGSCFSTIRFPGAPVEGVFGQELPNHLRFLSFHLTTTSFLQPISHLDRQTMRFGEDFSSSSASSEGTGIDSVNWNVSKASS